jgi:Spy/CpxP family protein refolding chaperone
VNTWKVILATVLIFGAGVVTGGLLVQHSARFSPQRPAHYQNGARTNAPSFIGGNKHELLRRVEHELDLNPEQRERVDKIIVVSQERTRKLMEPVTPQMRLELQQTKEEIRAILTPAQAARFDDLMKPRRRPNQPREQRSVESYPIPPSSNSPRNP